MLTNTTLNDLRHGLERENLRVDTQGKLSQRPHFEALGVSAHDPRFTLDFAECQLEVVTPIHESTTELMKNFSALYAEVQQKIAPETLWRASMPPSFHKDEIKLAHFGNSPADLKKQKYRKGLCYRYGKMMQIISGIHYNLSFPDSFFHGQTRNDVYFRTMRQFMREYWLLIVLFGASPICFASSLKPGLDLSHLNTDDDHLYYGPTATSLRLSELGYHNPNVPELQICYDSVEAYATSLKRATETPYAPYADIPPDGQLNDHFLQIENEYYAPIRPKPFLKDEHLPLTERLLAHGVNYLEIRLLDLNPLLPLEIDETTLDFIDVFMLYMATKPELALNLNESKSNALLAAKFGLNFDTRLQNQGQSQSIGDWGEELLQALQTFALTLSSEKHLHSVEVQRLKWAHPERLPAQALLAQKAAYLQIALAK